MMPIKSFFRVAWTSTCIVPLFILLTIISTTAASVKISWSPNHPAPEGYRVFTRRSDQYFNYTLPDWEGCETSCTIDGLEDQTAYYFVIQAFDGQMDGDYSAEIQYLPPEITDQETRIDSDPQNENSVILNRTIPDDRHIEAPLSPPIPLSSEFYMEDVNYLFLNLKVQAPAGGHLPTVTHWQIYETQSGDCALDFITDRQLSRLRVSNLPFYDGRTYHWRARFFDSQGRVSDWSEPRFFHLECNAG